MKKKTIIIILTILILIPLGYLLFEQVNTMQNGNGKESREVPNGRNGNNETSDTQPEETVNVPKDWEKFEDAVAGYSINHPPGWNTNPMESYMQESTIESFERGELDVGQVPENEIKIAIRRFIPESEIEYTTPKQDEILNQKQINIANKTATWRRIQSLGTNISIELSNNENQYVISAYPANSVFIEDFETMLKTFEFIPSVDIENPLPNTNIESPLKVSGKAPGTWFFEATLTAQIEDQEGNQIATTSLTTEENWMTEEQVSFEGTIEFEKPNEGERLTLIIKAANPSGLPENEKILKIPITYSSN